MKLKDLLDHDHPERFYVWTKFELEFINARVRAAYAEGVQAGKEQARNTVITDAAAIRAAFEKDCG